MKKLIFFLVVAVPCFAQKIGSSSSSVLNADYKMNVLAASTANIDLTEITHGATVIDGVTITAAGQRFLAKNQSTSSQNGIYVSAASGEAAVRASDSDTWAELPGSLVVVGAGGSANANKVFVNSSASTGTLGSTAISYTESASAGGGTKTIARFFPADNEPPASNYATLDTRNSHPVLDFDTTTQEAAIFRSIVPEGTVLTGGVTVCLQFAATSATSGTIGWVVGWERIASGGIDIDSDSWGTDQTVTATTVSGTSGITTLTSVNFSQAQLPSSLAAGEMYRIRIRRDVATDTATGDAELLGVEIKLQ